MYSGIGGGQEWGSSWQERHLWPQHVARWQPHVGQHPTDRARTVAAGRRQTQSLRQLVQHATWAEILHSCPLSVSTFSCTQKIELYTKVANNHMIKPCHSYFLHFEQYVAKHITQVYTNMYRPICIIHFYIIAIYEKAYNIELRRERERETEVDWWLLFIMAYIDCRQLDHTSVCDMRHSTNADLSRSSLTIRRLPTDLPAV